MHYDISITSITRQPLPGRLICSRSVTSTDKPMVGAWDYIQKYCQPSLKDQFIAEDCILHRFGKAYIAIDYAALVRFCCKGSKHPQI